MPRSPVVRAGACLALALLLPSLLEAQAQESCAIRGAQPGVTAYGVDAAYLPVDRLDDIFALGPGASTDDLGRLNVRGAGAGQNSTYIDGVQVTPGLQGRQGASFGGSYYGARTTGIWVGTNSYQSLRLTSGMIPLDRGNATGGILEVGTMPCAPSEQPILLRAGVASDALFGTSNGLGFNRFTLSGTGRAGRLEFGGSAALEGYKSVRLGMEQNESPVYVLDGIDTTITFDNGTSDETVDIARFRTSDGIRLPSSANSNYTVGGHIGLYLGERNRLRLSAFGSQGQARQFDYQNLYNPAMAFASRAWSRVLTASWYSTLAQSERLTLSAEAHASLQWDNDTDAPLSSGGERDTRDPALGLLIAPVDFRFDGSNFPVNDQLIENFRSNTGRLSPYDVLNPDQYTPIDRYRNNAYGLLGFTESGGPVGRLTIFEEKRLVGQGTVTAQVGAAHRFRVGVAGTKYDTKYYSSNLTSQAFSDAFIESPKAVAAFGEYRVVASNIEVTGGLRLDHFESGASHKVFPRWSSLSNDPGSNPLVADKGHSRVSPRIAAVMQANPKVRVFGGYTALARIPDFTAIFSGINTDLSVTNTQQVFGSDLDFERASIGEIGMDYLLGGSTAVTGTFWVRNDDDLIVSRLNSEVDPFGDRNVDIRRYQNALSGDTRGLDLRITQQLGSRGQAWATYSFVSPDDSLVRRSRKHTATAAVMYETGRESNLLGGILRNTGVYGVFRFASGTAYTRCPETEVLDVGVLSDEICSRQIVGRFNGARLPAFKVIDLRVTRGFMLGNTEVIGFVDARNLLNLRSVVRVFAQTGETTNERELERARTQGLTTYGTEATVNGVRNMDGSIDLTFGGAADPRAACGNWSTSQRPSAPNCIYLIGAEERFGNGDHIFTVAEQTRAIDAFYYVARGEQNFTAPARRARLGVEVRF